MVRAGGRLRCACRAIASSAETGTTFKAARERQPLHGRDADPQPGKRTRTGNDREQVDGSRSDAGRRERAPEVRRQALAVRRRPRRRSVRSGPRRREHRRAAGAGGGVEGQDEQGTSGTFCLRCYTPGLRHRQRLSRAGRANAVASCATDIPRCSTARPCLLPPSTPAGATPAMRQFFDAKRQHRDAILFFRMGDFYEMFYEDALTAARALELTLTSRSKDASGGAIPMCGVPHHAADTYVARLVRKGFRVAICEQMEDPKKAKGIVRREVVRVVSPGTLTDASYLDAREPAFLIAIGPAVAGSGLRRGAARPVDRRVHDRRIRGARRAAGASRRAGGAAAARSHRADGFRRRRPR